MKPIVGQTYRAVFPGARNPVRSVTVKSINLKGEVPHAYCGPCTFHLDSSGEWVQRYKVRDGVTIYAFLVNEADEWHQRIVAREQARLISEKLSPNP